MYIYVWLVNTPVTARYFNKKHNIKINIVLFSKEKNMRSINTNYKVYQ